MNQPAPLDTPEPKLTTEIIEYRPVEAGLAALREKYEGVVFNVSTANGLQEARNARLEIREPRYECEKIRKRLKAPALEYSRRIDTEAARITAELEKLESPIDVVIKREEAAAEERREAKLKAEMERVARLRRLVEEIRAWPLAAVDGSTQELRDHIRNHEGFSLADLPREILQEAAEAKEDALAKLQHMLASRELREAEDARLAAERTAERERQAAEDKRLREERERIEAETQRQEALRQQALREAAAERERWAEEQAAERAELDRQHAEHARIERELAEERARITAEREEDERDAETARTRLMEIISGDDAKARLDTLDQQRVEVSVAGLDPYPWEGPEPSEPCAPCDPPEPALFARTVTVSPTTVNVPRVSQVQAAGFAFPAGATVMRVRFEKRGGHYHCLVFSAPRPGVNFEKNGDLVFDEAEWPDIKSLMHAEFIEERSEWP